MVSTSHQFATEAALDVLERGGSAVDAYLAAAVTQTVVEPEMTTLAGALGVAYYDAESNQVFQLGGGYARPKAEPDIFHPHDYTTGRTVMVPGFVAAAHAAWSRWGKLAWPELFAAAIRHAETGVPIDHLKWGWAFEHYQWLGRYPEGRELWLPDGHLLSIGDTLRQPRLAATLRSLAAEGPDFFYRGGWARRFVESVRAKGGFLSLEDMAGYAGVTSDEGWLLGGAATGSAGAKRAIGTFREFEVVGLSNAMIVLALNLVELADLRSRGRPAESAESLYLLLRIVQEVWHTALSYGPRTHDTLISKEYARQLWPIVELGPPRPYQGIDAGTCVVVVVDQRGNIACGSHSSSSTPYGTGIIVDGVIANRVIFHRKYRLPAGVLNYHMIFRDGRPMLVVGSPSRSMFPIVFQNTVNVLEYGMDLWESVNQPIFGSPGPELAGEEVEAGFSEDIIDAVERRGLPVMRIAPRYLHLGSCQAVQIDRANHVIHGVADPRRLGVARGL
jgi:gamma-glutamyltranspeptidase/glutathione hydrolase